MSVFVEAFIKGVNKRVYDLIFEESSSLSKFLSPDLQQVNCGLKISAALNLTQICGLTKFSCSL